jgi:chaperonin GroES
MGWDKKLAPMPGKIILRFFEAPKADQTYLPTGKIIIPDTHKHDEDEAEVLAVGPGRFDANGNYVQPPVSPGDRVLSNAVWGKPYRYFDSDGAVQKVVIVGYDSIIAKVN